MTLTLSLTPEQETRLTIEATALGMPIETYVLSKVFPGSNSNHTTPEPDAASAFPHSAQDLQEWQKAFDDHLAWLATVTDENTPAVALEDMSREKLFEGRGEIHE